MQRVIYLRRPRPARDQHGLQQQLERAFQRQWAQTPALRATAREHEIWQPPADVYESDTMFVVRVELAGMRDAEIAITLDERSLRIEGQRDEQRDEPVHCYHQTGIDYGMFAVEVFLARPVDYDHVTAHYDDGFLIITLPKPSSPAHERRQIPISD